MRPFELMFAARRTKKKNGKTLQFTHSLSRLCICVGTINIRRI